MIRRPCRSALTAAVLVLLFALPLRAEPVAFEARLSSKEEIVLAFEDESRRSVRLTRREGRAAGSGPLADTRAVEYGFHDLVPGVGGEANGYLVFGGDGGVAYLRWSVKGAFVKSEGGEPRLVNSGYWEIVGATGRFKALKGAGAIRIEFAGATERVYKLTGEIAGRD